MSVIWKFPSRQDRCLAALPQGPLPLPDEFEFEEDGQECQEDKPDLGQRGALLQTLRRATGGRCHAARQNSPITATRFQAYIDDQGSSKNILTLLG